MWTLTNQWDTDITTDVNSGRYRAEGPSVTFNFEAGPVWATTCMSTIYLNDDDGDFAGFYFTKYSYIEGGKTVTKDVELRENFFRKTVRIGSETMTSLTYSTDSTNIGARGVVSIQFWEKS